MPEGEALSTTKRKFYKALDALSNSPAAGSTEPAGKRVRHSASTTSSLSRSPIVLPASKKDDGTPKEPPNFSPWSHETFLTRLKTFSSVSKWHPKPSAISEVVWAKRGWSCVDLNTVACKGGCEQRVVVALEISKAEGMNAEGGDRDKDEDVDGDGDGDGDEASLEDALVQRYLKIITDGHSNTCLWRRAGCKDDIYRLQVVRPAIWQPELTKRYTSLLAIRDSIYTLQLKGTLDDTPNHLTLAQLLEYFPAQPPGLQRQQSEENSTKALQISLHGWRGATDAGNQLLHCDACFQRIGLWMYQPGYKPATFSSSVLLPTSVSEAAPTIDLEEMHRDHCPWRNGASQNASGNMSGMNACQILQRVVATWAREQRRRSHELQTAALPAVMSGDEDRGAEGLREAVMSRQEVADKDQERESRLRKLKKLLSIKRRPNAINPGGMVKKVGR